ncbi:MAG: hypothetical protein ABR497_00750 [Kiritimatiellia bacterium]
MPGSVMYGLRGRWCALSLLALALLCSSGCETDSFRHNPPPGQGSLIVDNQTWDRLEVFVDGSETNRVGAYDYEYYDLDPLVYRVVLMGPSGRRSHRADLDILEGRKTVMRVRWRDDYNYSVSIYFD